MTAEQLRPGAKIAAVHEAGHATVAEYLNVRVERVRLSGYWLSLSTILQRPELLDSERDGGETSYASAATLDDQAVVTAAAQVAMDELAAPEELACFRCEDSCKKDVDDLRRIANECGVTDSDFQQWRLHKMERAREIIGITQVREAIRRVAADLLTAPLEDGLTGKHVREALRACETPLRDK